MVLHTFTSVVNHDGIWQLGTFTSLCQLTIIVSPKWVWLPEETWASEKYPVGTGIHLEPQTRLIVRALLHITVSSFLEFPRG